MAYKEVMCLGSYERAQRVQPIGYFCYTINKKVCSYIGDTVKFAITFEQDEDGYTVVSCPALPGCHSQGRTKEEAIVNIREAIQGYIASMRKHGEPIHSITEVEEVEVTV